MKYSPPSFESLVSQIKLLDEYKGNNSDRLHDREVIYLLTAQLVKNHNDCTAKNNQFHHYQLLGLLNHIRVKIKKLYKITDPNYSEGIIYSSGSQFLNLIEEILNITSDNQPECKSELRWLNEFYLFVYHAKTNLLEQEAKMSDLYNSSLLSDVIASMRWVMRPIRKDVKNVIENLPSHISINHFLLLMHIKYKEKCHGNDNIVRLFQSQLISFVAHLCENKMEKDDLSKSELDKLFLVQIGVVHYILVSILDTYKKLSPKRARLYILCCEALNISSHHEINHELLKISLFWFKEFFRDTVLTCDFEDIATRFFNTNDHFIKGLFSLLAEVIPGVEMILAQLVMKNESRMSFTTFKVLGLAGGAITMPFTGGMGAMAGDLIANSDLILKQKIMLSNLIDNITKKYIGAYTGGGFSFHTANQLTIEVCANLFGNFFQYVGFGLGFISFGGVGLIIDFAMFTMESIIGLVKEISTHPQLVQLVRENIDWELAEILLTLPAEAFISDDHKRLHYVGEPMNFFKNQDKETKESAAPSKGSHYQTGNKSV